MRAYLIWDLTGNSVSELGQRICWDQLLLKCTQCSSPDKDEDFHLRLPTLISRLTEIELESQALNLGSGFSQIKFCWKAPSVILQCEFANLSRLVPWPFFNNGWSTGVKWILGSYETYLGETPRINFWVNGVLHTTISVFGIISNIYQVTLIKHNHPSYLTVSFGKAQEFVSNVKTVKNQ